MSMARRQGLKIWMLMSMSATGTLFGEALMRIILALEWGTEEDVNPIQLFSDEGGRVISK